MQLKLPGQPLELKLASAPVQEDYVEEEEKVYRLFCAECQMPYDSLREKSIFCPWCMKNWDKEAKIASSKNHGVLSNTAVGRMR